MSKKALRRDEFLRHLMWISVLAVGIVLYYYRLYDMVRWAVHIFVGIVLLVHGTVPRSAPTGTV